MEAGAPGARMDLAVMHVEQKAELDPVTVHSRNMEVKSVQDKPRRLLTVTRIHVQVSLRRQKEFLSSPISQYGFRYTKPPPSNFKRRPNI